MNNTMEILVVALHNNLVHQY